MVTANEGSCTVGVRREISRLAAVPLGLCLCTCLCGCAVNGYHWTDHTALVLRPSHHQAAVAFSFGAEPPARETPGLASRNVAAAIGAAMMLRDDDYPIAKPDNVDFKGGRLFLRVPRSH